MHSLASSQSSVHDFIDDDDHIDDPKFESDREIKCPVHGYSKHPNLLYTAFGP